MSKGRCCFTQEDHEKLRFVFEGGYEAEQLRKKNEAIARRFKGVTKFILGVFKTWDTTIDET